MYVYNLFLIVFVHCIDVNADHSVEKKEGKFNLQRIMCTAAMGMM